MRKKDNVVFYLPPEMLKTIMDLKDEFFILVGYFPSRNSEEHITTCEILSDAVELKRANDFLEPFVVSAFSRLSRLSCV